MTVKSQSLSLREFVQKRSAEGGGEGFPEVTPNVDLSRWLCQLLICSLSGGRMGMCCESSPPLQENQPPQRARGWAPSRHFMLEAQLSGFWHFTCVFPPYLPPSLPTSSSPSLPEMSWALQTPDTASCISFLLLCNKLPQAPMLKPTQMDYLTILPGSYLGMKSRCQLELWSHLRLGVFFQGHL